MELEATKDTESAATNAGWKVAVRDCNFGEGGGKSAGVAVGCRGCMGLSVSCDPQMYPDKLRGSFAVKHVGAVCRGITFVHGVSPRWGGDKAQA